MSKIWGLKLTLEGLKGVQALFAHLPEDKQKLMLSVSDYLQSVLGAGREFKKLWETAEQELVREGVLKEGGYMNTLEYMSIREQKKGWRKGLKEGRQEERQEVILKMLKEKLDIALVSKITGMPVKEIKKLKNGS